MYTKHHEFIKFLPVYSIVQKGNNKYKQNWDTHIYNLLFIQFS